MAFVGNIDQSVEQIVNSTEYDLFLPLPPPVEGAPPVGQRVEAAGEVIHGCG